MHDSLKPTVQVLAHTLAHEMVHALVFHHFPAMDASSEVGLGSVQQRGCPSGQGALEGVPSGQSCKPLSP